MKQKLLTFVAMISALGFPYLALAHENYVLPQADIQRGMMDWSINVLDALKHRDNLKIALLVGLASIVVVGIYFWYMRSRLGITLDEQLKKWEPFGHVVLRVALALSFLASAHFNSFLGPEIPLTSIPLGFLLKPVLYILGVMLLIGLFTELAAVLGLVILILTTFVYKDYMLTYFNYYGEFVALIFFGSRIFSLDRLIAKSSVWWQKFRQWEIPIIRVTYGLSVLYPAITIKLLHPAIMVEIAQKYNLMQFHWLFPQDPLLISLGTGLAQIMVGLAIIFGFQTRLNSFATFILYVMSILFFQEAVWPHYILLSLALYLIINDGGAFTIDNLLMKRMKSIDK